MIQIENCEVVGMEAAIRGMRNPMNSWGRSDTLFIRDGMYYMLNGDSGPYCDEDAIEIGENDMKLMRQLADGGSVHAKYRRMIVVYADIVAPLYWWKEFDTYKVGTVANSCSTMHKIHAKEFTLEDFSCEHLLGFGDDELRRVINVLNVYRKKFLETQDKRYWWQMIQLLPSSYNQRRTVMLNYEVLSNIFKYRKDHKLDEWRKFCSWIFSLPYSEIITGVVPTENVDEQNSTQKGKEQ